MTVKIDKRARKIRIFKMPYGWKIIVESKFFSTLNVIELERKK